MRWGGSEISEWLEAEREKLLEGDGDGGWRWGMINEESWMGRVD